MLEETFKTDLYQRLRVVIILNNLMGHEVVPSHRVTASLNDPGAFRQV